MTAFHLEGGGGGAFDTAPRTRGRLTPGNGRKKGGRESSLATASRRRPRRQQLEEEEEGLSTPPRSAPLGVFFLPAYLSALQLYLNGVSLYFAGSFPQRKISFARKRLIERDSRFRR